jgi:hypothetical protein
VVGDGGDAVGLASGETWASTVAIWQPMTRASRVSLSARTRVWQALEGGEKGPGFAHVGAAVLGPRRLGQVRGKGAAPFGAVHPCRVVVEHRRPVPAPAQPFHQAERLPVGAVVDAAR